MGECRFHASRCAVGLDLHPVRGDFPRQSFGVRKARGRTRQTDVHRIDSQRFHQVEDFDFFLNAG